MADIKLDRDQLKNIFDKINVALDDANYTEVILLLYSLYVFIVKSVPEAFRCEELSYNNIIQCLEINYQDVVSPCSAVTLKHGAILMEVLQQDYQKIIELNDKPQEDRYSTINRMFKLFAYVNNRDFINVDLDFNKDVIPLTGKIIIPPSVQPLSRVTLFFIDNFYNRPLEYGKLLLPFFSRWYTPKTAEVKNINIDSTPHSP